MKTKFIAIAALAAMVGFTACNNDNEGEKTVPNGTKALVNISLAKPTDSRAAGVASSGDNIVSSYVAFIFNADGSLATATPIVSASAAPTTNVEVIMTSGMSVSAVANIPDGLINTITTKSDLETFVTDLAENSPNSQYDKRWASGSTPLVFSEVTPGEFQGNVTVNLTFISARIQVTIDNQMTNYSPLENGDGNFVLKDVVVLNAGGISKLFGTPLIPSTGYMKYSGIANPAAPDNFVNWPSNFGGVEDFLKTPITDGQNDYHFYVFENNANGAAACPTIVALAGKMGGKDVYFPVHLASYENFVTGSAPASVIRGNSYDITITLKGDATYDGDVPGGSGGDDDPTIPTQIKAKVNIEIVINKWIPVTLEKEFN